MSALVLTVVQGGLIGPLDAAVRRDAAVRSPRRSCCSARACSAFPSLGAPAAVIAVNIALRRRHGAVRPVLQQLDLARGRRRRARRRARRVAIDAEPGARHRAAVAGPLFTEFGRNAPYWAAAAAMAIAVRAGVRPVAPRARRGGGRHERAGVRGSRQSGPREVGFRQELGAVRSLFPYLWPRRPRDLQAPRPVAMALLVGGQGHRRHRADDLQAARSTALTPGHATAALLAVPVMLIVAYGVARVGAQLFAELRDARVRQGRAACGARGRARAPSAISTRCRCASSRAPDRRPVARHRARHPRHRVPAVLSAVQRCSRPWSRS